MSIVSYPRGLPLPQVDGFSHQTGQVFITSEPADGPSRYRLDRITPSDVFSASLVLKAKQKSMFNYFYNNQLDRGMRWFYMPLMYDNVIKYYLCHLREIPSFNLLAGNGVWTTTFNLEVDVTAEEFFEDPNASSNFEEAELPILLQDGPFDLFEFYPDVVEPPSPDKLATADVMQSISSPA